MGCGCRGVGNGLALRRAVLDQLLADGLHAGVGELVERQHDEHARVEHHRHHAEQNFDGGQHLDRLHAAAGGIVDVRQDPAHHRPANRQANLQAEQVGGEHQPVEAATAAAFFVIHHVRGHQPLQRRGGVKDEQEQDVEGEDQRDVLGRGDENQQADERVGDDDPLEGGDAVEAAQQTRRAERAKHGGEAAVE